MPVEQVLGSENTFRITADKIDGGWSTRSFPTQLAENKLFVADNVVYNRDGVISKRPGNDYYGGNVSGVHVGSGSAILALCRFYTGNPQVGTLYAHSGTQLWKGNDVTGLFSAVATLLLTSTQAARFTPMYDPDMSTGAATALFVTDGVHRPQVFDGVNTANVQVGGVFLPNGRTGVPITPLYSCDWDYHLCYAGEPTEPTALYISDALRPERFTGVNYIDSALSSYVPYYPAGRDGKLGIITGILPLRSTLLIFYTNGIVIGTNTGSYGGFQYQFTRLSSVIGAVAPQSIIAMDTCAFFFGGDRFYATDGASIAPLADDLPSLYSHTSRSIGPPEMTNATTVVAVRRGGQYWASYDSAGGALSRIAVFDTAANGGWSYNAPVVANASGSPQGGAWARWPTGMQLGAGIECRGPGDNTTFPLFWGSSQTDLVFAHDTGSAINAFGDVGTGILIDIRSKSYFLERPASMKTLQGGYLLCQFTSSGAYLNFILQPYAVQDAAIVPAPSIFFILNPSGTRYGSGVKYGTGVVYLSGAPTSLVPIKFYPTQIGPMTAVALGVTENSNYPFALVGFMAEITVDPIAP